MNQEIVLLSEIESVRKNPWMYIGSVGRDGAHHLLHEVVYNAVDEAQLNFCSQIKVTIGEGFCEVQDNGRGIPTEMHATEGISAAEVALTRLHAGSKFKNPSSYFTAGLHGVGLSCVNALSTELQARISRNGEIFIQSFARGKALNPMATAGKTVETGTAIRFMPDLEIFKDFAGFEEERCVEFLENLAYLNPGLEIIFENQKTQTLKTFSHSSGIQGLMAKKLKDQRYLFSPAVDIQVDLKDLEISAALTWTADIEAHYASFVNCVATIHGGTHVNALRSGILKAIQRAAIALGKQAIGETPVEMEEAMEGIALFIDCKMSFPNFEGQTKSRLTNSEITAPLEAQVAEQLTDYFLNNPKVALVILDRIRESRNARTGAKRSADRIYLLHGRKEINEEVYKDQFGARSKNWHDSAVWITDKQLLQSHADMFTGDKDDGKESIGLDVCCGSGVVGASFRPKVKKMIGLDLTPQMVNLAKERLDEVHQGNVYHIPFADNTFDLVCTREVLHLLPYPERPVSEIFRVLKPGAQFVVGQILPFAREDAAWMYRVFKKKQPLIFNMFQEEDFRGMLSGAGFVDMEMKELQVWESIDVWINSYETTAIHRHEIRELFRTASAEVKAVHPFRILPNGEIHDLWRWCIFSVRKPE